MPDVVYCALLFFLVVVGMVRCVLFAVYCLLRVVVLHGPLFVIGICCCLLVVDCCWRCVLSSVGLVARLLWLLYVAGGAYGCFCGWCFCSLFVVAYVCCLKLYRICCCCCCCAVRFVVCCCVLWFGVWGLLVIGVV